MDSQYETTPSPITTQGFFAPQGFAPTTTVGTTATTPSEEAYKAYEQKNEELLKGINFEKLAKLIDDCKKGVEAGKDKDLILLVGRTGAGKSTTLNYLMGCPLKSVRKGMKSFLDVADGKKPFAEIGHDLTKSKTLYPQVVPTAECPQLAYVDLAGIGDTRILEEKLCASVAFPMALHSARSVKGIILVIDANDLTTGRGEAFVDLLKILGSLFKNSASFDPMNTSNQMLFVFTKVPMDCGLKEILETVKDAKNELMETSQKHQKELNEATEQLAFHLNLLSEWKQVSNKENISQDKLKLQIKIIELASQKPFNEKPEIQNIQARCKILAEEVQNTFAQLMGLEFILKHADEPDNLFIIRGNEKDDKAKLLNSVAALQHAPPIPKEDFDLNGNKNGEWVTLDKIIRKIASQGAMLLSTQSAYDTEVSTLKKYKKLVENQRVEQINLLLKLKSSKLSKEELEKLIMEILNKNEELIKFQMINKEKKQAEKKRLENELSNLDTSELMRYKHPNLEPIFFWDYGLQYVPEGIKDEILSIIIDLLIGDKSHTVSVISKIVMAMANRLLSDFLLSRTFNAGIPFLQLSEDINKVNLEFYLDIISQSLSRFKYVYGYLFRLSYVNFIASFIIMSCSDLIKTKMLKTSHDFQYDDIPYVKVEKKFKTTGNIPSGCFDWLEEVILPEQGKYKVTYKTNRFSNTKAWIKLFVEKRIHPEIKPDITRKKNELEILELMMNGYDIALISELYRGKDLENMKLYLGVDENKQLIYRVKGFDANEFKLKRADANNDQEFVSRLVNAVSQGKLENINLKDKIELLLITSNKGHTLMIGYLENELKKLSETLEEEKNFLGSTSNDIERQEALIQILEKRESQHENRMIALRGVILGYQTAASNNYGEFSRKIVTYISMLKQLCEIIGANRFVQKFLKDCELFIAQKNIRPLNTVWGRKQTPDQQPEYKVKSADFKPGCSIIAFFKPEDKLESIGWFGKIGCTPGALDINQQLPDASRARRDSAGESMKEKIAADLYDYLSNDSYIVPTTRLAELPIKNQFTENHFYTPILLDDINRGRSEKIDEGVYVMSKKIQDYQDLAHLKDCVLGDLKLDFLECLQNGKLPEEVMVEGKKVPLKGLMEILAASRLLADTDVLGGGAKNAGFVIERDIKGEPIAVRAVKIDPGYAFNFRGPENKFYQSLHPAASFVNTLQDKRDLQYGNMSMLKPLLWDNLTESQQKQFIEALNKGLNALRDTREVLKIIEREDFKQTPKQRALPTVKEHLVDLEQNLKWQEEAYSKELAELRKFSFSSYSM